MDRVNKADDLFRQGFSCSQAVLAGFGDVTGLEFDQAVKLGRAFGSGMRRDGFCGALIGAALVLGFKEKSRDNEREARYAAYDYFRTLADRFEQAHGSAKCRELLGGVDLATAAGQAQAVEAELFTTLCPRFVHTAAGLLEELL
ncbi:MAG: C-GCAxxG-C-C family protein [Pseudomonadota bacterium]